MIGQPLNRVDGPAKVTGQATYAYETWDTGQPLYGMIVPATIARGRVTKLDVSRAEQAPGVKRVLTHANAPRQHPPDMSISWGYGRSLPTLASPEVHWFGQPIACVIATTFEQARSAAALVEATYELQAGVFELDAALDRAVPSERTNAWFPGASRVGDFDATFARAPIQIDALYVTPYVFAQPMEPHCAFAVWNGDVVTVHASVQTLFTARLRIAATFGLEPRQVRVLARYVGGGFGSKLGVHEETILAVMAARELGQPVKVALTRQQVAHLKGHRPLARQRVRLGAERDGRLIAFAHDVTQKGCVDPTADYLEQTAATGRALYAAPNRQTTSRAVPLDLPNGGDIRAPGEAPGLLAIESAVDELAYALDLDPIELRIRNEPTLHPELGVPFSERHLVECLREGARRFGWERRPHPPASLREGRKLVGFGVAAAIRGHYQYATTVQVRLAADGELTVQSDMTDIGTGTYTILTQVASERLGVPVERVRVELGDTEFPPSGGSGGSWGATNSCSALAVACRALRDQVLAPVPEAERARPLADLVAAYHPRGVEATGSIPSMDKAANFSSYSLSTYGAHFAEVEVDSDTGEVRVRRMLGIFDVGRVFNPKTARSQLIGGMIWGVSAALLEEGVVDPRFGAFVNRDLAQYLVPVHADIPTVEAVILDYVDDKANELGAKGLGELGICGAGAAIANAVYNACGVRVRDFPITIEKLLPHLPVQ